MTTIAIRTDLTAAVMPEGHGIDASEAARGIIDRVDQLSLETTGQFMQANGEPLPW